MSESQGLIAAGGASGSKYTPISDDDSTRQRRTGNRNGDHGNSAARSTGNSDDDDGFYKDKPVRTFWQRHGWNVSFLAIGLVLSASLVLLTIFVIVRSVNSDDDGAVSLAAENILSAGQARCEAIRKKRQWTRPDTASRTENDRAVDNNSDDTDNTPLVTIIRNATVYTGYSEILNNTDILLKNGIIASVGPALPIPDGAIVVDASGLYVTPGIVDLHSHAGVDGYPSLTYQDDTNEATNPIFPQLRSIDGFDPRDPAIPIINSGGVTTSLILPGSANVIGGEAFVIKHRGKTVEDLRIKGIGRYMKMACGENPKRVYGSEGRTPDSRMGSAWLLRERLADAANLVTLQNSWCDSPDASSLFPDDLSLDSLSDLIRGNVNLNVHCYEVRDLEMIIRVAKEFGVKVAAVHHALEAYLIPEIIRDNNITVAGFVDHWGFKREGFEGTVYAPKIITDVGGAFAIKSDHPVTDARFLMHQGMIAYHYGHKETDVIASLTRIPAESMGLDYRIGTIEVGKDADIAIWDRRPVEAGAFPVQVYVDGFVTYESSSLQQPATLSSEPIPAPQSLCDSATVASFPPNFIPYDSYVLKNVSFIVTLDPAVGTVTNADLVVVNGSITFVGTNSSSIVPAGATVFNVNGGTLVPGAIAVGATVGIIEIPPESSTNDGSASGDLVALSSLSAAYGFRTGGKHAFSSAAGGTLVGITPPSGGPFIQGLSAAFQLGVEVAEKGLIKNVTALHVQIGASYRSGGLTNSISGQLQELERLLSNAAQGKSDPTSNSAFYSVVGGTIPLVARVDQADFIASLVQIVKRTSSNIRLVILDGIESWLVASDLASVNATVLLSPQRCAPSTFETLRCSNQTLRVLTDAGVTVGLGVWDVDNPRHLFIEAAWTLEPRWGGFTGANAVERALATVTSVPAAALGINSVVGSLTPGKLGLWTLFAGEPLQAGQQGFAVQAVANVAGVACAIKMH